MINFSKLDKIMEQAKILDLVIEKKLTQKQAANILKRTDRQIRNKLKKDGFFG